MIFVGDDWSEDHHDVEVLDESGKRLARRRLPDLEPPAPGEQPAGDAARVLPSGRGRFRLGAGFSDAVAVLGRAPTPAQGQRLSRSAMVATLRRGGRQRGLEARAEEIRAALRAEHFEAPAVIAEAMGAAVSAAVGVIAEMNRQVANLEAELRRSFEKHPDVEIVRSLPGLGVVVGARVLGEFGDDPTRYVDARAKRTTPALRRSPSPRARRRWSRLASSATGTSPTPRTGGHSARRRTRTLPVATYDAHRPRGNTHDQALRALANRLVGIDRRLRSGRCTTRRLPGRAPSRPKRRRELPNVYPLLTLGAVGCLDNPRRRRWCSTRPA